jgi:hypothetical protein
MNRLKSPKNVSKDMTLRSAPEGVRGKPFRQDAPLDRRLAPLRGIIESSFLTRTHSAVIIMLPTVR